MELTGYTRGTIDAQCRRMGLRMLITRPYTPREERFIRENAGEMSVRRIAGILGRGVPCLQKKINQLGLRSWYRTEGLSQKDFAELMGVQAGTVRKWIERGHLRIYDGKISSIAAKEFLREKAFLYSVRRVDDDWFKSVVFEATA